MQIVNQSKVKASVIIPVLNQGKFIKQSLDSVCNQTLTEIEIIVVEGGSNDETRQIVESFCQRDPRVQLILAPSVALSAARELGLKAATGEYILFLDGDDRLALDALELLYQRAEEADAGMVAFNFIIENRFNQTTKESSAINFIRLSGIDFIRSLYEHKNYWMIWSVFHKRSLYRNPIEFSQDLFLGEDALLTTQLAYYSRKVMKENSKPLLFHSIHKDPETKRKCMTQKQRFDLEVFPQLIRDFLKNKPEFENLEESWCSMRLETILRGFKYRSFEQAKANSHEALLMLKRYPALRKHLGMKAPIFRMFAVSESLGKMCCNMILPR